MWSQAASATGPAFVSVHVHSGAKHAKNPPAKRSGTIRVRNQSTSGPAVRIKVRRWSLKTFQEYRLTLRSGSSKRLTVKAGTYTVDADPVRDRVVRVNSGPLSVKAGRSAKVSVEILPARLRTAGAPSQVRTFPEPTDCQADTRQPDWGTPVIESPSGRVVWILSPSCGDGSLAKVWIRQLGSDTSREEAIDLGAATRVQQPKLPWDPSSGQFPEIPSIWATDMWGELPPDAEWSPRGERLALSWPTATSNATLVVGPTGLTLLPGYMSTFRTDAELLVGDQRSTAAGGFVTYNLDGAAPSFQGVPTAKEVIVGLPSYSSKGDLAMCRGYWYGTLSNQVWIYRPSQGTLELTPIPCRNAAQTGGFIQHPRAHPRWSPDGRFIAYDTQFIYDTQKHSLLVTPDGQDSMASGWSSNGTLAYGANRSHGGVTTVAPGRATNTLVVRADGSALWSVPSQNPDGDTCGWLDSQLTCLSRQSDGKYTENSIPLP